VGDIGSPDCRRTGFPVFFAGIIFTEFFRRREDKAGCFGSNIVGAVAGGLAQNVSFVIGLKTLLLLAVGFYVLAAICGRREKDSYCVGTSLPQNPDQRLDPLILAALAHWRFQPAQLNGQPVALKV
jgi:hypothetical protein